MIIKNNDNNLSEHDKLLRSMFSGGTGKRLLEYWHKKYIDRQIALNDDLLEIGKRQGVANFIMHLENKLRR